VARALRNQTGAEVLILLIYVPLGAWLSHFTVYVRQMAGRTTLSPYQANSNWASVPLGISKAPVWWKSIVFWHCAKDAWHP